MRTGALTLAVLLAAGPTAPATPLPAAPAPPAAARGAQPRPIALGAIVDGSIDEPGEVDEYTFTATAGQSVSIYLQGMNGVDWTWIDLALLGPAGSQPLATLSSKGNAREWRRDALRDLKLPAAGIYTLRVKARAAEASSNGPYRLQVIAG